MSDPFVGEIRMFGGNFAPMGWAACNGQLLPISENETLFNLIGTTYGGDGQSTFALPDLRGRVPIHQGTSSAGTTRQLAEMAGTETVTLTTAQIPAHTHVTPVHSGRATSTLPGGAALAANPADKAYATTSDTTMSANAVGAAGASLPHENTQPSLVVTFIISLFGIFPSPS